MQLPLPFSFYSELNCNNFIKDNNENVIYQLDSLIDNLNNNIFLYSENYGKTHLLHAYTLFSLENNLKSIYINLKEDAVSLVDIPHNLDILFVDNLQCINKEEERRLFNLYNQNINIVLTSKTDNNNLNLLKDLNTRINKSSKLIINSLDDRIKLKILLIKIKERNLNINIQSLQYLFKTYSRDLKNLINAINKLDKYSLIHKVKINQSLIKKILLIDDI